MSDDLARALTDLLGAEARRQLLPRHSAEWQIAIATEEAARERVMRLGPGPLNGLETPNRRGPDDMDAP